jgi:hypothetical protein
MQSLKDKNPARSGESASSFTTLELQLTMRFGSFKSQMH